MDSAPLDASPAPVWQLMRARPLAGSRDRAHGLDVLRAAAILLVIPVHIGADAVPPILMRVRTLGWMGVDLFFVLSGYLIGSQLLRPCACGRNLPIGVFYARRAFRILPAFLVVLALYCWVPQLREQPEIMPWWRFLTFTMNLGFNQARGAFSHAWSLCVEEQFYLLFPLLCLALLRRPSLARAAWVVAAVALFGIAIRSLVWAIGIAPAIAAHGVDAGTAAFAEYVYYPTYTRLDGLLVGAVMAGIEAFRPDWWARALARGPDLALASVAAIAVAVWLFSGPAVSFAMVVLGFPVLSIGLGLLVASSLSGNGPLARVRVVGAGTVATLAYSLYLSHKAAMHLGRLLLGSWMPTQVHAAFAVHLGTSFLAAFLLYLCVERPFLKLRDRLLPAARNPIGQGGGDRPPSGGPL